MLKGVHHFYVQILTSVVDSGCYPGSDFFPSRIRIKEFIILTQTIFSNLSEIWSGSFIPDPDFFFIPHPGYKGPKGTDPRSGSAPVILTSLI
jgi:hypothetical protein